MLLHLLWEASPACTRWGPHKRKNPSIKVSAAAEIITYHWESKVLTEGRECLFISQDLVVCSTASWQGQRLDNQILSVCGSFKQTATNLYNSNRWTEEDFGMSLMLLCDWRVKFGLCFELHWYIFGFPYFCLLPCLKFCSEKDCLCELGISLNKLLNYNRNVCFIEMLGDWSQSNRIVKRKEGLKKMFCCMNFYSFSLVCRTIFGCWSSCRSFGLCFH